MEEKKIIRNQIILIIVLVVIATVLIVGLLINNFKQPEFKQLSIGGNIEDVDYTFYSV